MENELQKATAAAHQHACGGLGQGQVAQYIPQLRLANPNHLAVAVTTLGGQIAHAGDAKVRFTMQSIAKVVLLAAALQNAGFEKVFSIVGMEPTGDPFNSIIRLETVNPNKPLNPMINAGAIAVTSCIPGATPGQRFGAVLDYARLLLGNPQLGWDEKTFQSERSYGDRNRALAYMMRSAGVIEGNVEEHLEVYFKVCALYVDCTEISMLGAVLANGGVHPLSGQALIAPAHIPVIRSLMATCGMYDASGEFALRVGIPAKSGVGGGIMGAVPGRMGVGVFSPALDRRGNSLCGVMALEHLSHALSLSIF